MKSNPTYTWSSFRTPAGVFSLALDSTGAVAATAFGGRARLQSRLGPARLVRDERRASAARRAVLAYFKDPKKAFRLKLAPAGTAFRLRAWKALARIPAGQTRTYGQLAADIGGSPRAIGGAMGANPICLILPCHRVIGSDGSLTGFAFGEGLKRRLLQGEGAL
ncbi:MAG TPA: methylated-DNA--[protein]-cysteine S-methyltransferase [Opitutaceae bacterium]|jgi:methylated-DNA-[protein]-cysteine S-methyltransferase|nr:methylated-DNA--[protein]-cysteine S-methyltransferase [Opitutaceae bacterium]